MRVACIDIGTNSVRYLAAEFASPGEYTILDRGLAAPRLGEGLSGSGRLKDAAIERTIRELRRIKAGLDARGVGRYRAVGTEALRLASNREAFIRRALEIGLEVEILSGEEEARLVYLGASGGFPGRGRNTLLADVGGGSTEIIAAREGKVSLAVSLPLGCVRLKELAARAAARSAGSQPELEWMRDYCRAVLKEQVPDVAGSLPLVGLGGTFTTLAAIKLRFSSYDGEKVHGCILTAEEIAEMEGRLFSLPLEKRKAIPGLDPPRADIIIPGIIIVRALMGHLGIRQVTVSDRGILFGLLVQYSG